MSSPAAQRSVRSAEIRAASARPSTDGSAGGGSSRDAPLQPSSPPPPPPPVGEPPPPPPPNPSCRIAQALGEFDGGAAVLGVLSGTNDGNDGNGAVASASPLSTLRALLDNSRTPLCSSALLSHSTENAKRRGGKQGLTCEQIAQAWLLPAVHHHLRPGGDLRDVMDAFHASGEAAQTTYQSWKSPDGNHSIRYRRPENPWPLGRYVLTGGRLLVEVELSVMGRF